MLAALGTAVGLALAELAVRAFVPVRNVGPSFTVFDPLYGKRLKKSFSCWRITPEFTMRFTTNSLGYRGPEPDTFPDRPVLFVGDSFTMGYGVNDGEEYPALVRGILAERFGDDRIPVVNAAVGATGNGRWVKFLRSEAGNFDPRCIVFQICGNDFSDNIQENMFSLGQSGELIESASSLRPGFARVVQRVVEAAPGLAYSRLVSFFRETRIGTTPRRSAAAAESGTGPARSGLPSGDQLTYGLLEEIIRLCREHDWPLLVILVDIPNHRAANLNEILHRNTVPSITVPRKDERPDLYYEIDGHWNTAGHARVAELLVEGLLMHEEFLGSVTRPARK